MNRTNGWNGYSFGTRLDAGGHVAYFRAKQDATGATTLVMHVPADARNWMPWSTPSIARFLVHPNIVQLLASEETDDTSWFAFDYVDGFDLREILSTGPMKIDDALLVTRDACCALAYAASAKTDTGFALNFTHAHVRPRSMLISRLGAVKLTAFGMGTLKPNEDRSKPGVREQHLYAAPEILAGNVHEPDPRGDIYAVGAVLYEMLTGSRWHNFSSAEGLLAATREEPRPALDGIQTGALRDSLEGLLSKALAHDPRERFQTAADLLTEVDAVVHRFSLSLSPETLAARVQRLRRPEASMG